jgi:hypothetical protein
VGNAGGMCKEHIVASDPIAQNSHLIADTDIVSNTKHTMQPQRAIGLGFRRAGTALYTGAFERGARPHPGSPYRGAYLYTGSWKFMRTDQAQYQASRVGHLSHLRSGVYARTRILMHHLLHIVASYFRELLLCEVRAKYEVWLVTGEEELSVSRWSSSSGPSSELAPLPSGFPMHTRTRIRASKGGVGLTYSRPCLLRKRADHCVAIWRMAHG